MIKGILLDIDNTLYDYDMAHKAGMACVSDMANSRGYSNFLEVFKLARDEVHNELARTAASHNRLLYFQRTLEKMEIRDIVFAKALYDAYWGTFLDHIVLFDGVIDFLSQNQDKKICFLTDLTADIQYRKIEKIGLSQYVGYILTSEEAGVEKPDAKMFNLALRKIALGKDEVCMIGDSYGRDILGALNVGIKPYWKTEQISDDECVTTFNDFYELSDKMKQADN